MQVQQVTVFLVACTLSVLVVAYAQEDAQRALMETIRDIAMRVAAGDIPDYNPNMPNDDDYKRGGRKNRGGIKNHLGIHFGKRQDSESSERQRNSKRMRFHTGLLIGKRSPVQSWNQWQPEETYNPDWQLGQFDQ